MKKFNLNLYTVIVVLAWGVFICMKTLSVPNTTVSGYLWNDPGHLTAPAPVTTHQVGNSRPLDVFIMGGSPCGATATLCDALAAGATCTHSMEVGNLNVGPNGYASGGVSIQTNGDVLIAGKLTVDGIIDPIRIINNYYESASGPQTVLNLQGGTRAATLIADTTATGSILLVATPTLYLGAIDPLNPTVLIQGLLSNNITGYMSFVYNNISMVDISATGTIHVTGDVYATAYHGDGSALTGIAPGGAGTLDDTLLAGNTSATRSIVLTAGSMSAARVNASGTVAIVATGTVTAGNAGGASGYNVRFYGTYGAATGTQVLWNAAQSSLFIGRDRPGNNWTSGSGRYGLAVGNETKLRGEGGLAVGNGTVSDQNYAVALGDHTAATGVNGSVAMGYGTTASGQGAFSSGISTTASGNQSTAMGNSSTASGNYAVAMGTGSTAGGTAAFAAGQSAVTGPGNTAVAIGHTVTASGYVSTALGMYVTAGASNNMAFGHGISDIDRMVNTTADSLMVGFNSNIPTLYVGPSAGAGTVGRVGIGTATPQVMLDVDGDISATGTITATATVVAKQGIQGRSTGIANAVSAYQIGTSGAFYGQINNGANAATVIIGTTTGTGNLIELQKSGNPKFTVDNSGNTTATGTIRTNGGYNISGNAGITQCAVIAVTDSICISAGIVIRYTGGATNCGGSCP